VSAESRGQGAAAQNPNSSAGGRFQFIDSTWVEEVKQHAPEVAKGKTRAQIIALKKDPKQAALADKVFEGFTEDNADALTAAKLEHTEANLSLLHFAGRTGGINVLQADDDAKVSDVLSAAAVKANPFLKNWTIKRFKAWAAERVK
jgi:hypothetical protein